MNNCTDCPTKDGGCNGCPLEPSAASTGYVFNINNYVLVKLTPVGRELHHKEWLDTQAQLRAKGGSGFDYVPPVEDSEGWSQWQLWDLMHIFGKHLFNGCKVPFETTIKVLP